MLSTHQALPPSKALEVITHALERSGKVVAGLGVSGRSICGNNLHGQAMLRADWEAEEAVIETLRRSRAPVRLYTEEHGVVDIVRRPCHTAILDGLDGSGVYTGKYRELYEDRGIKRHFSTMLGFFSTLNPAFGDFIAGGWFDHASQTLYSAKKGGGAFAQQEGRLRQLCCDHSISFGPDALIYLDSYFPELVDQYGSPLRGLNVDELFAANAYLIDLIDPQSPRRAGAAIHCSAKGGLEFAIGYGVIREAQGVITDQSGRDLADVKYLDFISGPKKPYVAAVSQGFASDLVSHCDRNRR